MNQGFFDYVIDMTGVHCNIDRFASNYNTKLPVFNSASFCVGTSGVDSFLYDWGDSINWLFPPPRLVLQTVNHLRKCNGIGLLLTPEWKSSSFYPYLLFLSENFKFKVWTFQGKGVFCHGADKDSFFGPNFNSAVNVWFLDFRTTL